MIKIHPKYKSQLDIVRRISHIVIGSPVMGPGRELCKNVWALEGNDWWVTFLPDGTIDLTYRYASAQNTAQLDALNIAIEFLFS